MRIYFLARGFSLCTFPANCIGGTLDGGVGRQDSGGYAEEKERKSQEYKTRISRKCRCICLGGYKELSVDVRRRGKTW